MAASNHPLSESTNSASSSRGSKRDHATAFSTADEPHRAPASGGSRLERTGTAHANVGRTFTDRTTGRLRRLRLTVRRIDAPATVSTSEPRFDSGHGSQDIHPETSKEHPEASASRERVAKVHSLHQDVLTLPRETQRAYFHWLARKNRFLMYCYTYHYTDFIASLELDHPALTHNERAELGRVGGMSPEETWAEWLGENDVDISQVECFGCWGWSNTPSQMKIEEPVGPRGEKGPRAEVQMVDPRPSWRAQLKMIEKELARLQSLLASMQAGR